MSHKFVRQLKEKKHRTDTRLFLVEGAKNIEEVLHSSMLIEELYVTTAYWDTIDALLQDYAKRMGAHRFPVTPVSESALVAMGTLLTNNAGVAVVRMHPENDLSQFPEMGRTSLVIALSQISDPGNMGTIMRTADWYGITHIVASDGTVDAYNPKVIAASMGSFTRISVTTCDLSALLEDAKKAGISVIGADLEGTSTHTFEFPRYGYVVLGNESHGIASECHDALTHRVMIPRFGGAESLNVSVASGILLDTWARGRAT